MLRGFAISRQGCDSMTNHSEPHLKKTLGLTSIVLFGLAYMAH